ncbi:TPA: hypothetical protein NKO76_004432 [Vibrio parahaemolyticus]|nr:hypothetical protein [Vibrio parahaemolyticus]
MPLLKQDIRSPMQTGNEALQRESMVIMSQIGPDQGPTGRARLGSKEKQEGTTC